ncbi:MAG: hypothetical protein DRJ66_07160, partial [Thermoprotei archaeon]
VIAKGVAVIGELYGPPYEQALAVNVKGRGLVIFVGCSHPGVDNIVKKAVSDLNEKPYIVIGGFHLVGASEDRIASVANSLIKLGLKKIYPMHCSGDSIRGYIRKVPRDIRRWRSRTKDYNKGERMNSISNCEALT